MLKMDEKFLGRAVEYHGPDFLRQLQLEQEKVPSNIFLHLQKHRPQQPEINDQQFILNVRRFVSKKADILFRPVDPADKEIPDQTADEDSYAKMPPLETFMGIDPHTSRKHLYNSFELKDIVIGVVTSILDTGLVVQLLCLDNGKNRDIDDLRVTAFVACKDIPQMFPTQNPVEGYQVKDYIRGVVTMVNPENESLMLSLKETALRESIQHKPTLGLIHEEDFPIQYRRKLHIRGLTFDELVNSILGFSNPGNVPFLMDTLQQKHDVSVMRGLYGLKISDKDYADALRKSQSQKWAYQCVAQGIHDFKKGLQSEAMQSFNKALQIDKTNVEALVARGALYANNESYTRALTDFEEALGLNRKHPNAIKYMHETLLAKGKCHEDDKQYADARKCYERAIEIMPDSDEAKEYLRYIIYKEDHSEAKEKKPVIKKERSPSPVPFKDTTDKLKLLIQEDKKVSRSKVSKSDVKEEKHRRGWSRSRSPRQRKKRQSSSSSSSSSSSRSRSSKGHRRSKRDSLDKSLGKSPSRDVYVKKEVDKYGSSKVKQERSRSRDRDVDLYEKSRSSDRRSRDEYELNKNQEREVAGYGRSRNAADMSAVYSFSRSDTKIPGLGESPLRDEENDVKPDIHQQYIKTEVPSERRFSEDRSQTRVYEKGPSSRRPEAERSPSWGRESSAVYPTMSNNKGDNRRRRKDSYEDMIDEELYGKSDHRNRSRSRSPDHRNRMKDQEQRTVQVHRSSLHIDRHESHDEMKGQGQRSINVQRGAIHIDRHESVTPTKDEVSDRLGLEDISSPEEHHFQQSGDYKLRAYGSREEYERQKSDRKKKQKDDYSPDGRRHRSKDSRERSPRRDRSSSYKHRDRESSDEGQHTERRIISVSKKVKKSYDDDEKHSRKEDKERRHSPEETQERRKIVMSERRDKKVKHRSSSSESDIYEKDRHRQDDIRKEKVSRKSRTPESKGRYVDKKKRARRDSSSSSSSSSSSRSRSPRKVSRRRSKSQQKDYHQSRSPSIKKGKDRRSGSRYEEPEDTEVKRVISMKPKKDSRNDPGSPQEQDQRLKNSNSNIPDTDIFADLPPPKVNKGSLQMKFATYVPRAVKLKQQHPTAINPERQPDMPEQRVEREDPSTRSVNVKSIRDVKKDIPKSSEDAKRMVKTASSRSKNQSRSRSRSRSRDRRKRSPSPGDSRSRSKKGRKSRSRSRSRRRSGSRKRSRSRRRSTSRKRSRSRHRSRDRRRSRSRSKSRERRKSEKDHYKGRKRSTSSSSTDSRSGKRGGSKYDRKPVEQASPKITMKKIELEVPKISSRWDSPEEEKKSRWSLTSSAPVLVPEASVIKAKEKMENMLAANLMSDSPPPHRSMKPEEKEALKKKWKELSVSPIEGSDDELPEVIKQRIAEVEKKIMADNKDSAKKKTGGGEGKSDKTMSPKWKSKLAGKNIEKLLKLRGIKSKWDSDSDKSSRSRSRSLERKPRSDYKKDDRKRYDSRDDKKISSSIKKRSRSRSRDDKKISTSIKKRSRSRSRSRGRYSSKKRRSRSRSRSRSRRRSRSKERISSTSRRRSRSRDRRSRSNERRSSAQKAKPGSEKKDKQENGKGLPDIVASTKSNSDSKSKSVKDTSPKFVSSKALFKSKWSSGSDSDSEVKKKPAAVAEAPKDSLSELEKFYNKLKNDSKQNATQRPPKKF